MRFLLDVSPATGVSRDQFVDHVQESGIHPEGWELYRNRIVTEYMFKVGDTPGLIAFVEASSAEEARGHIDGLPLITSGLVSFELDEVSPIADF